RLQRLAGLPARPAWPRHRRRDAARDRAGSPGGGAGGVVRAPGRLPGAPGRADPPGGPVSGLKTAVVVLAAGASRRLGQPKQLVCWRGRPLVHHAVEAALEARVGPVTVVVGAREAEVRAALDGLDVNILAHPGWSEGLGSSIRTAVWTV